MDFPKLLNKPSLDLLKNDFPHSKKFELEHSSTSKYPSLDSGFSFSNNTYSIYSSFKNNIYDTKNEIKFDNSGLNLLDIKYQPHFLKNLNVCGKYSKSSRKEEDAFEVYSEYSTKDANICSSINVRNLFFKYMHVFSHPRCTNFKLGGLVQGKLDVKSLQYSLGAAYTKHQHNNRYIFSLRSNFSNKSVCDSLIFNLFFQNLHINDNSVSIEVLQNFIEKKSFINIASIWYFNNKDTFIKTKISNDTNVALSLTHKYNEFVTVSLGSQVDLSKISLSDNTKFGIKLYLKS